MQTVMGEELAESLGRYPQHQGPLPVGQRQVKEILYFGPATPGSPWEAMKVVLENFAHANQLNAPMELFAGSCRVQVFTAADAQAELCRQLPRLRRKHPARSLVIQAAASGARGGRVAAPYALLTVVDDARKRTLLLNGRLLLSSSDSPYLADQAVVSK